jgi:hypothetical protein|tara:strand:+ start:566 stop:835 length:270 start_codon:yes stop_codon:yes gene_type:complete
MATKKLDKEHLEQINDLRERYAENANVIGNISIEQFSLDLRLTEIAEEKDTRLLETQSLKQRESELVIKLRERYGDGEINIDEGTFTDS